jgi:phosphoserine aminotransferase
MTALLAHTYNPGIRVSMYNAMPVEGVVYITNFMRVFMKRYPLIPKAKI